MLVGVFAGGVTMTIGMLLHEAPVLLVIVNGMWLFRWGCRCDLSVAITAGDALREPVTVGLRG